MRLQNPRPGLARESLAASLHYRLLKFNLLPGLVLLPGRAQGRRPAEIDALLCSALLHTRLALGCRLPCNYLTALSLRTKKPQSHLWDLEEGREIKRHSKNADSPVLNLPGPVCGKGRAAGLAGAGAGRAIPSSGSRARPTLHRPRSEGVAPRFHVLREGTMARGSVASSGVREAYGENKERGT